MHGQGSSCGKQQTRVPPRDGPPLAGELFLRFCAFVRRLGVPSGGETMVPKVMNLLEDGEVEERSALETCRTGNEQSAGGDEVSVSVWMS